MNLLIGDSESSPSKRNLSTTNTAVFWWDLILTDVIAIALICTADLANTLVRDLFNLSTRTMPETACAYHTASNSFYRR